jgi:hypothetical protein
MQGKDTQNRSGVRGVGAAGGDATNAGAGDGRLHLFDAERRHGRDEQWEPYIRLLQQRGVFQGGSAIGGGACVRKDGTRLPVTQHIVGYIRITADSLDRATQLLAGNPHFERGGTVEVRELPLTD